MWRYTYHNSTTKTINFEKGLKSGVEKFFDKDGSKVRELVWKDGDKA